MDKQNYLIAQHPDEEVIKIQARLKNLMSFRPHSTTGLAHKKLTYAIAMKHAKTTKAKLIALNENPELQQINAEKMERERLRTKRKLEMKQRHHLQKTMMTERGIDIGYSDDEEDEEIYQRGNQNMLKGLDSYEEYGDDDFGNVFLII